MDSVIKQKLTNIIKGECTYVMEHEQDIHQKLSKMNTLFNLQQILDNYDDLEPILQEYFSKKADKEKWER